MENKAMKTYAGTTIWNEDGIVAVTEGGVSRPELAKAMNSLFQRAKRVFMFSDNIFGDAEAVVDIIDDIVNKIYGIQHSGNLEHRQFVVVKSDEYGGEYAVGYVVGRATDDKVYVTTEGDLWEGRWDAEQGVVIVEDRVGRPLDVPFVETSNNINDGFTDDLEKVRLLAVQNSYLLFDHVKERALDGSTWYPIAMRYPEYSFDK
jgi:hypothetical protein